MTKILILTILIYNFLVIFYIFCVTKIIFLWLPIINPYSWPYIFITKITENYFKFWLNIFPKLNSKYIPIKRYSIFLSLEFLRYIQQFFEKYIISFL